ncbi:hypothetical protein B0H17DRAFT_1214927 [Mycena rosella]|uniref:Uncharacterized protein n=1 Tax=Mycena rosella TaxID=1033263 RepID=A0AAD7CLY6_MYCRO|nr:hypothetical protein B0H17DRAFT_1214927 [Mycena rosella]
MSPPNFSFTTTAEEAAAALADEIKGKNGSQPRLEFAPGMSVSVVIRLKLTKDAIMRDIPSANVRALVLDLSSLAAVRKAAAEVNTYPEPLHFKLTEDNLERQMATNHIGPFLLTKLLAPKLLASGTHGYTPRVVFTSSVGHGLGTGVNLNTLGSSDPEGYDAMGHEEAAVSLKKFIILDPDGVPNKLYDWKTIPQRAAILNDKACAYLCDCTVANELIAL